MFSLFYFDAILRSVFLLFVFHIKPFTFIFFFLGSFTFSISMFWLYTFSRTIRAGTNEPDHSVLDSLQGLHESFVNKKQMLVTLTKHDQEE